MQAHEEIEHVGDFHAVARELLPSISLDQAIEMQRQVDKALLEFPEVTNGFSPIGTAEVVTDAQEPNKTDV